MRIEIVEMQLHHIRELTNNLREGDRLECVALNLNPISMLVESYKTSILKKVTLLDGKVAAAWGLTGAYLGYKAHPWLLTSSEVDRAPLHLAAAYRREVHKMLELFPLIENYCDFAYKKSLRMLQLCGFTVEDPVPYGPNGSLFCRFWLEAPDVQS